MRHRQSGRHLGRDSAHRRSLYRNLVTDLLRYERITTTEAKAKEIRPIAEKIITLGKRGDLHARRQALKFVFDKHVVDHVFEDIAPRMAGRPGGYLRITALEPRKGDGALMTAIELVDYAEAGDGAYVPPAATTTTAAAAPAAASATAVAPPLAETAEPEADTADEDPEEPVADAPEAQAEEPATAEADEADEPVAEANTEEAPTAEAEEPAEASAKDDVEEDEKDGGS